ncbi:hypothetical protein [Mycoplasma suis]|uniref:Uncharacterized protein n=1 Tax=Mycoplasma suis (strain KI_3806) TaxID=708248 RepID=F0V312_MYCS3|nr:hypothetical protein [Mycoplasma suis]CBZ40234.1 hypothetical protein MSUIS_01410 [Mycoplasma suis KI3806]
MAIPLGGIASAGGLGLGYIIQDEKLNPFKKEIKEKKDVSPSPLKDKEKDLKFSIEVIYNGGMYGDSPICKGWEGDASGRKEPKILEGNDCQKLIKSTWEESSGKLLEQLIRADQKNVASYFKRFFSLPDNKRDLLDKNKKEKWSHSGWECTNKEDKNNTEKVIIECNNTKQIVVSFGPNSSDLTS